jgi:uncharacterized protein DUF2834
MRPGNLYLGLCVIDTVLPSSQLIPFLQEHGSNVRLFFEQPLATPISRFFGMDVLVSSVVLWVLVLFEGRRAGMTRLWAPIVANLTVGVWPALHGRRYSPDAWCLSAGQAEGRTDLRTGKSPMRAGPMCCSAVPSGGLRTEAETGLESLFS